MRARRRRHLPTWRRSGHREPPRPPASPVTALVHTTLVDLGRSARASPSAGPRSPPPMTAASSLAVGHRTEAAGGPEAHRIVRRPPEAW